MTVTSPASVSQLRTEFSGAATYSLKDAGLESSNACSSNGDFVAPYNLTNWVGYNHAAVPVAPTGLSTHPGPASQDDSPLQDTQIYIDWGIVSCADVYDVYSAATELGVYGVVGNDIVPSAYADTGHSAETTRWYKIKAISDVPTEGPFSAAIEGKTAPQKPLSFNNSDDFDCAHWSVTLTWSNGTSPGVRSSVVKWRYRLNGGAWSAWFSTARGATSVIHEAGAINDGDTLDYEAYYDEETAAAGVSTTTNNVICPT